MFNGPLPKRLKQTQLFFAKKTGGWYYINFYDFTLNTAVLNYEVRKHTGSLAPSTV